MASSLTVDNALSITNLGPKFFAESHWIPTRTDTSDSDYPISKSARERYRTLGGLFRLRGSSRLSTRTPRSKSSNQSSKIVVVEIVVVPRFRAFDPHLDFPNQPSAFAGR